jgi:hypothetical protein
MKLQMKSALFALVGGTSLEIRTKENMESRFKYDFANVRIHTDEKAARSPKPRIMARVASYKPYLFARSTTACVSQP